MNANHWDGKDWDARLFAYVEGELTGEQKTALEAKLAADASLRAELELWKEARVEQDFYDTTGLEAGLLKEPAAATRWSGSVYVFVIMLFTSLFSYLPLATHEKESLQPFRKADWSASAVGDETKNDAGNPETEVNPAVVRTERASREKPVVLSKPAFAPPPRAERIPLRVDTTSPVPQQLSVNPAKLVVKKPALIMTRKQRVAMQKMKEKARQRRIANEFMKGNVPYVVPLNTRNF